MSGGMLVFVAAVVAGGTGAFFTDTETSTGNVFTAGDVNINLVNLGHQYLADGPIPPDYVIIDEGTNSFDFTDLKPGDHGVITGDLENTGNPAFICARVVDTNVPSSETSPFEDMLQLSVLFNNGLSFANTMTLAQATTWFSPDPTEDALAVDSNETLTGAVQYCFGDYQGDGTQTDGTCTVDWPNTDYNDAQGQSLTLDIVYFAIQQRNNADFKCEDLTI